MYLLTVWVPVASMTIVYIIVYCHPYNRFAQPRHLSSLYPSPDDASFPTLPVSSIQSSDCLENGSSTPESYF